MEKSPLLSANDVKSVLRGLADESVARQSLRFFKTGKGEYGETDCFLGIRVPELRAWVKQSHGLGLDEVSKILKSPYHEERLYALLLLVQQYAKANEGVKKQILVG